MINSKACSRITTWARNGIYQKNSLVQARVVSNGDGYRPGHIFNPSDHPPAGTTRRRPRPGVYAFSTQPVALSLRQTAKHLRARTNQWLGIPVTSWTANEVSRGRFLVEAWSQHVEQDDRNTHKNAETTRAAQQSKILRRWLEVRCSSDITVLDDQVSVEIVEMLHQCLSAWRQVGKRGNTTQLVQEAVDLIYLVDSAAVTIQDPRLRPSNKAYSMCYHILAEHADCPSAFETLKELWQHRLQAGQQLDLQLYNSYLHALAKCSLYHPRAASLAEDILLELSSVGKHVPTAASFVAVMHAWANRGDVESAQRAQVILDQLIRSSETMLLSTEAFNVCIDGWAKANQPEKAEALLDLMCDVNGVEPTEVSFNSAVHAWAKAKSHPRAPQRAEALLRRMESSTTCRPTLETYTAVLDAWSHTKQPGPKVEKLLDVLEERHADDSLFPAPNKWTYMVAIRAWAATRPLDDDDDEEESLPATRAQALVDRMEDLARTNMSRRRALQPCPMVYAALFDVWSQSKRSDVPEQAVALFRTIPSRVFSDERSKLVFHKVLGILAIHGRAREARRFLQEILDLPWLPDIDSYNLVMMAYTKSPPDGNTAQEACSLLRKMESEKSSSNSGASIQPTIATYIHAMVSWGNSSQPDAAEQAEALFWEVVKKSERNENLLPTVVAANCVLRAWAKSREGGAAHKAESMWKWMEATGGASDQYGIQPDATSCLHMMQAWAHSGRRVGPSKAESYFLRLKDLMSDREKGAFLLKTAHFNLLIMAWGKSDVPGAYNRIKELVDEMLKLSALGYDLFPDEFSSRWILNAANAENKIIDAMSLLEDLRKKKTKRNPNQQNKE